MCAPASVTKARSPTSRTAPTGRRSSAGRRPSTANATTSSASSTSSSSFDALPHATTSSELHFSLSSSLPPSAFPCDQLSPHPSVLGAERRPSIETGLLQVEWPQSQDILRAPLFE